MKLLTNLILITCLVSSSFAFAKGKYYGINYVSSSYSDQIAKDASLKLVQGTYGSAFNSILAAELRFSIGLSGDEVDGYSFPSFARGGDTPLEVKNIGSAFLKAGASISQTIYPYAILGVSAGEFEVQPGNYTESDTTTSVSYGTGVDVRLDYFNINFEYVSYFNNDDAEVTALSVGLSKSF